MTMHQPVEHTEDEPTKAEEMADEIIEFAYQAYLEGADPQDLYLAFVAAAKVSLCFDTVGGMH